MAPKSTNYLSLFVWLLAVSAFSTDRGYLHVINDGLKEAAKIALHAVDNQLLDNNRVDSHTYAMLEALVGKKRNGRAFNPSISAYPNRKGYLFAVRVMFHHKPGYREIVPGNQRLEEGKNFWWKDHYSPELDGGTLYFYADAQLKQFTAMLPQDLGSYSSWVHNIDVRVIARKDDFMVFDPRRQIIASRIDWISLSALPRVGSLRFDGQIPNARRGNNFGLIFANFFTKNYLYIDWFFKEGIKFTNANPREITSKILNYVDPKYPLIGLGSTVEQENDAGNNAQIMPLFSFGSTHLQIGNNTYLGVGHTKIYVDENEHTYKENSAIDLTRKNLVNDLKQEFGNRYIRHDLYSSKYNVRTSYHYLMYFYWFKLDGKRNPVEMKMSDSFLPIDVAAALDPENYIFSLVFPMGIAEKHDEPETLLLSMGMGDYYAAVIEMQKDKILELCRHDATHLDMKDYEYKIMRFDGKGEFSIGDRFEGAGK